MKTYTVAIQVIKVYHVEVVADNEDDAISKVYCMDTLEIADQGRLKDVSTDYAEVMSEEDVQEDEGVTSMLRTYVVFLDTGFSVTLSDNVDPAMRHQELKKMVAAKFLALIKEDPTGFDICIEDDCDSEWECRDCGYKDIGGGAFVSTQYDDDAHWHCPHCGGERIVNNNE